MKRLKKVYLTDGFTPHKSEQSNLSKTVKKYRSLRGSGGGSGIKVHGDFRVHGESGTTKGISVPSNAITSASGNIHGKIGSVNYNIGGNINLRNKSRSLNVNLGKDKYNLGFKTYKNPCSTGKSLNLSVPLSDTTTVSGSYNVNKSIGEKTQRGGTLGVKFNLNKLFKKKK